MKKQKKIISLLLTVCILFLSIAGCATTVHADNVFTYMMDGVGFVREMFGLVGDVGSATYNGAMKIKDDIVGALINNPETDYGVTYNADNDTFNFRKDENNNVIINQNFYNMAYEKAVEQVRALDGYYLLSPTTNNSWDYYSKMYNVPESKYNLFYATGSEYFERGSIGFWDGSYYFYLSKDYTSNGRYLFIYGSDIFAYDSISDSISATSFLYYIFFSSLSGRASFSSIKNNNAITYLTSGQYVFNGTTPVKLFYSQKDLNNYLAQGKTYIPKMTVDVSGLKLPENVLSGNQLSVTINEIRQSADKSWPEEQADIFITRKLQEFLDSLFDSGEPDVPVNPTPTPGFDDGEPTPTPVPDNPDSDSVFFLEKIYELFDKFVSAFDKYSTAISKEFGNILSMLDKIFTLDDKYVDGFDKLTTYLSQWLTTHDGKVDVLVDALDKILKGEAEGVVNGCKYDYTVLSDFLTKMWNQSDGKLDTMIKLLEENNEYQKKIVDSLNQIKALLIADTVMEFFKDRSGETANKAKEKFPTSIPWDIVAVVNAMCAEPQTPVIKCPIKIESLNINEEIIVDLSTDEWSKLAKTCRALLSVLFVLYLVHLSRELFFKGGDD